MSRSDALPMDCRSTAQRELCYIVEQALEDAKRQGATATEVDATSSQGLRVSVRMGELETIEHSRDRKLVITVYVGHRSGSASTADISQDAISRSIQAALTIAKNTSEDDCNGLADPGDLATDFPDLDNYHPWSKSIQDTAEIVLECESAARSHSAKITNSEGASFDSLADHVTYGNSHGFLGCQSRSQHSMSCVAVASDKKGMQRDYWYDCQSAADDLMGAVEIGKLAAERSISRLGARQIKTQKTAVLFEPAMAKSLISHFLGAISGGRQYKKATFLLNAINQNVFPGFVEIEEMPHLRRRLASSAFDDDGVATRQREIITAGTLQTYLLSSYTARKLRMRNTGHAGGVRNLLVKPSDEALSSSDAMLRKMDRGLLVTELIGSGANLVNGDYSRGAAGFWIENGAIAYPVQEITIAGNLRDIFNGIIAIGADLDDRSSILMGGMLIDNMTIAGG